MASRKKQIIGEITKTKLKGEALYKALERTNSEEVNTLPPEEKI